MNERLACRSGRYTRPSERARWAERFERSGLTQKAFALQHGLKLSTLQWWLAQNRPARATPRSDSASEPSFTEVKFVGSSGSWAVEVVREKGTVLRLAHDVPVELLRELLALC
jgi:hypothetical protein